MAHFSAPGSNKSLPRWLRRASIGVAGLLFLHIEMGMPAFASDCDLLHSIETLSEETLDASIERPRYGRAMILLGFFETGQGDGMLFFEMARKLQNILSAGESRALGMRYTRKVLTYYNFPEAYPVAGIGQTLERVERTIDHAIKAADGKRIIWVNLDGFRVERAFRQVGGKTITQNGVFNEELAYLLVPGRIDKVRWLLGGREIRPSEAKQKFAPFFQDLEF